MVSFHLPKDSFSCALYQLNAIRETVLSSVTDTQGAVAVDGSVTQSVCGLIGKILQCNMIYIPKRRYRVDRFTFVGGPSLRRGRRFDTTVCSVHIPV